MSSTEQDVLCSAVIEIVNKCIEWKVKTDKKTLFEKFKTNREINKNIDTDKIDFDCFGKVVDKLCEEETIVSYSVDDTTRFKINSFPFENGTPSVNQPSTDINQESESTDVGVHTDESIHYPDGFFIS